MIAVSVTAREWPLNRLGTFVGSNADITATDMSMEQDNRTSFEGKNLSLVTPDTCGFPVLMAKGELGLASKTDMLPFSKPVAYRSPSGATSNDWMALGIYDAEYARRKNEVTRRLTCCDLASPYTCLGALSTRDLIPRDGHVTSVKYLRRASGTGGNHALKHTNAIK